MARWSALNGMREAYVLRIATDAAGYGRPDAVDGQPAMPSALTDAALARPRAVLGAVIGVLVLAGVIAAGTVGRVGLAPSEAVRPGSEPAAVPFPGPPAHRPPPAP